MAWEPVYIGVDPGQKGAAVSMNGAGKILDFWRFSKTDGPGIAEYFNGWAANIVEDETLIDPDELKMEVHPSEIRLICEFSTGRPGQGRGSLGKAQYNIGHLHGVFDVLSLDHQFSWEKVRPQDWQKRLGLPGRKGSDSKGYADHKKNLTEICRRKFRGIPDFHAEIADAVFIADYCRKLHLGLLLSSSQKKQKPPAKKTPRRFR